VAEELFLQDDAIAIASCGPLFINVFYGPATVARIEELGRHQRDHVKRMRRHAVLSLIDPGVGKEMGDDARKAARALSDEMVPHVAAHCFVVLGTGFFAALARSVIAGVQLLTRSKGPWRVTSDATEGLAFLAGILRSEGISVDEVAATALVERMLQPATRAAS
jgi:hypothetical protein